MNGTEDTELKAFNQRLRDNRLALQLTVKVDYILDGTGPQELKDNLLRLVRHGMQEGWITLDSSATVAHLLCNVEEVPCSFAPDEKLDKPQEGL